MLSCTGDVLYVYAILLLFLVITRLMFFFLVIFCSRTRIGDLFPLEVQFLSSAKLLFLASWGVFTGPILHVGH
jgi:hypothetical protein